MFGFLIKASLCISSFALLFGFASNIRAAEPKKEFRGIWVASILNMDYPRVAGLTVEEMKAGALEILDGARRMGMNAIILQVRPTADALYKSDIFPWARCLTGRQGEAPEGGFDPLAYWISQAHLRGLELHAWINPYRVGHYNEKIKNINEFAENNPARINPEWVVRHSDGGYYFDPALPEVRSLVVDGIVEILEKYDVDGIHLDDYFYPGTDFNDDKSYELYGGGMDRDDWRRENVNMLVRDIGAAVKEVKPQARYGISPFAIWQNKSPEQPLGSDTRGMEAYKTLYADTLRWVKEGWLDYICPQIYWNINFPVADYEVLLNWWAEACNGTDVDLYIGHAAYKEAEGKDPAWKGETIRQLQLNETFPIVKGSVFFRYGVIKGDLANSISDFYFSKRQ